MRLSGFVIVFGLASAARAADATSPVDYVQRNEPFAPGATTTDPKKTKPQTNDNVQDKRVDKTMVDKKTSTLGERQAPIAIEEKRDKKVKEKDSHRPEKIEQPTSDFNHKPSAISTSDKEKTNKPQTVAKYQDSMATAAPWGPAAATGNKPNFGATDAAATAKINRFVFRKNPSESTALTTGAPVTPAAGGGAVVK